MIDESYPSQTISGQWKVHVGSRQYRAWEYWLHREIGKRFFPEPVMVVWSEWPPMTPESAVAVANSIAEIRRSKFANEKNPIGGAAVPTYPRPWDGHIPEATFGEGKYPREHRPWRDILREHGRPIPHDDSPVARALDGLQNPAEAPLTESFT